HDRITKTCRAEPDVHRVTPSDVRRVVAKPPVQPIPSPPPSELCSRPTPMSASTSIKWITMITCCIRPLSVQKSPVRASAQAALQDPYRNLPRSLHDHRSFFHPCRR